MNVTKKVFETPLSGRDDWPPEDLVGFISWFQEKLDMIQTQHRHTASVFLEEGRGQGRKGPVGRGDS